MAIKRTLVKARDQVENITDLVNEFLLEKKAGNRSPETIVSYENTMKRFQGYLIHNDLAQTAESLSESVLLAFTSHLLHDEDDCVRPTTVNHYLRDLRSFIYWCQKKEFVPQYQVKLVREQETIKVTFSSNEQRSLIRRPSNQNDYVEWRTWAIVNWVLATGNRAKTICNIQMNDIDLQERTVTLRVTKAKKLQIIPVIIRMMRICVHRS